ncbi:MAG TPA: TetR family transcriptional regulator [Polyangiales bacterium]|jgi:AcrR family transcriptional regulator|nr:TetR family transcriptional regulator [Polyangiales bacterium]
MPLRISPERKEEKDRTREELQRAALRLGAAHGFASLGLREVAREAQIAPTSFYRHFEDMGALGLSLIRDKVDPLVREWAAALPPEEVEPVELVESLFRSVDRDPELTRFLVAERVGSSSALREELRNTLRALGEPLVAGIAVSKRSRALLDAVDLVTVVVLEGAASLLDCESDARPALRQRIVQRLSGVLAGARSAGRKS